MSSEDATHRRRSPAVSRLRERWFGRTSRDWERYHDVLEEHLRPGMTVVEVGPGKGQLAPFSWAGRGVHRIGLDVDPAARASPHLDRFELLHEGAPWPLAAASADLVVCRYVLEHVADPDAFFGEVARVLRPGGRFVFLTPNRAHPLLLLSALLPYRAHLAALRRLKGLTQGDVFPTHYRANSRRALLRLARRHGLAVEQLEVREFVPFGYLDFTVPGFLLAAGYHRVVTRTGAERALGASILGVLRRG